MNLLHRAVRAAMMILMVAMVASVILQVALRYLTYQPIAWTEELSRYVFVWLALLGAGEAARQAAHFSVDLLPSRLSGAKGRIIRAALLLVETGLYLVVAWSGLQLLPIVSTQHSVTLGVPLSVVYLAIPAGFGLMAFNTFCRSMKQLVVKEASAP